MNKDVVAQKAELVEEIYKNLTESQAAIVVEYRGLSVAKLSELRKELRKEEATLTVLKNSLVSRAAEKAGLEELNKELTGPNALVLASKDPSATAKVLTKFAKRNDELVVKGGIVEGKYVDAKGMKVVATLPNKEGLLSMLLSCLQSPIRSFACAVKAVADKKEKSKIESIEHKYTQMMNASANIDEKIRQLSNTNDELQNMEISVRDLKDLAKDKNIKGYARMTKDLNCDYARQFVYTSDNKLTAGFGGKVLYKKF